MITPRCYDQNPEFVSAVHRGARLRELAAQFGCSSSTAHRWKEIVLRNSAPLSSATAPNATVKAADEWTLPARHASAPKSYHAESQNTRRAPAHGGRWKRFICAFDVHGDKAHEPTLSVFWNFLENHWNDATYRIMGGDLWDFRPLRKGADAEERAESMSSDYRAGLVFLERMQVTHFLRGNHDERLWELAANGRGVERDFAADKCEYIEAEMARRGVDMRRYHIRDGVLQIGHLKVSHGFFNGVSCARQMAEVYGSVLFGHNHVIQTQPVAGLEHRAARCCGAMCELIMPYNERRPGTLRHANGFSYGVIHESTGEYFVWQAERIGADWVMPSDVAVIEG